jgi:parallel beta-helix repeat protein
MVYAEDGHYYAKDRRGNMVCVDSPTACIQEAINYITSIGGRIFIKNGRYYVSNTVIINGSNIRIYGNATLVAPSNVTVININNVEDVYIQGITVSGGQHGILITNSQKVKIENIKVLDSDLYGIYIYDSSFVDLLNSYIENTKQCGIAVESYATQVYGISIRNNKIINVGQSKMYCSSGIHLESHRSITDVDIEGNYVNGTGLAGISVLVSQRVGIRGNVILNSGQDGVVIVATSYSKIIGNIIAGSGRNNNAGYQNGIRIDDPGVSPPSVYNIISENMITDNLGHAIVERGDADYNVIINNITIRNSTPQIVTAGRNTVVVNMMGHVTRASGKVTIPTGATSVVVSHGLTCTPTKVLATPLAQPPGPVWVSDITSNQFTINTSAPPTTDLPIAWYAEC